MILACLADHVNLECNV